MFTNDTNTSQRIDWIDFVKAFCIIMVIVGHTVSQSELRRFIFSFHMPLFFILSGYTYKPVTDKHQLLNRIKRNAKRLLLPYLITFILSIPLVYYLYSYSIKEIFKSFLYGSGVYVNFKGSLIQGVGAIWFLSALFISKTLYELIQYLFKGKETLPLYILSAYIGIKISKKIWLPYNLDLIPVILLFIHIGTLLKKSYRYQSLIYIVMPLFWLYMLQNGNYIELAFRYYPGGILCIIEAVCGSLTIIFICRLFSGLNVIKPFLFIGQYSLELLCIHRLETIIFKWKTNQIIIRIILNVAILCIYILLRKLFSLIIKKKSVS